LNDALAIVAAPLPGLVIYLRGRRMLRWLGDPTFDERLWRHRMRNEQFALVSLVALGVLAWRWMPITLPLFLLSVWLGALPLRKRAFGEGWTLGEYLRHCVRVTLGVTSFGFALLFLPLIAGTAGENNCIWVLAGMLFWTYNFCGVSTSRR